MRVLQRGNRLSITPVSEAEWDERQRACSTSRRADGPACIWHASRIGRPHDEHRQLHQGDRPRPRRRPLARPRAGARPDEPGARRPRHRSRDRRLRAGDADQGRDRSPSSPASSTPRTSAASPSASTGRRSCCRRTTARASCPTSPRCWRCCWRSTTCRCWCTARRTTPSRVTTAEIFHDLGLTCADDARRHRRRLEPARAGVHPHRRALPAAGAAARGAPGRRPAQLGPHGRQAARRLQQRADAARRQLHPSRVRRRCWPSFLAATARRRAC